MDLEKLIANPDDNVARWQRCRNQDALPPSSRVAQARARFLPLTDDQIMATMTPAAMDRLLDDIHRPTTDHGHPPLAVDIANRTAAAEDEAEEPGDRFDGLG